MKGVSNLMIFGLISFIILSLSNVNLIKETVDRWSTGQEISIDQAASGFFQWAQSNIAIPIWLLIGLLILIKIMA